MISHLTDAKTYDEGFLVRPQMTKHSVLVRGAAAAATDSLAQQSGAVTSWTGDHDIECEASGTYTEYWCSAGVGVVWAYCKRKHEDQVSAPERLPVKPHASQTRPRSVARDCPTFADPLTCSMASAFATPETDIT